MTHKTDSVRVSLCCVSGSTCADGGDGMCRYSSAPLVWGEQGQLLPSFPIWALCCVSSRTGDELCWSRWKFCLWGQSLSSVMTALLAPLLYFSPGLTQLGAHPTRGSPSLGLTQLLSLVPQPGGSSLCCWRDGSPTSM